MVIIEPVSKKGNNKKPWEVNIEGPCKLTNIKTNGFKNGRSKNEEKSSFLISIKHLSFFFGLL